MGGVNSSRVKENHAGKKREDSLMRSVFFDTSILSEAIPIDSDKSVTLSEVHSSSVNSTCVDVSLPFLNEPDTIDSSNEQSPDPDTQKIFEFDEEKFDKNDVDPELNMMQILHAESPQQSLLLSAPDRCDLHRAPSCLPDVDDGDTNSLSDKESSCSEPKSLREDAMDEWQMSEDKESDTTDFGLVNEEKQAAAVQPSNELSAFDSCTRCEVYTMTFGGMYAYTATPSPKIDDSGKLDDEDEDKLDLKQSDQDVGVQLASKTSGTPYEVYTMNFGGLYTFTATTSDDATELEEQPNQTGQQLSEREESSLADSMEDKTDKQSEPTTPYEVYTVSFGGLHTFTATPSVSDRDINNSEALSATPKTAEPEANSSQMPMEIQGKVDKDCNQTTDKHAVSTPHEVHTVTFGGLYTFTATLPPIQCDGAPPMHAA